MSRQIKFRGQTIDTNEWVCGSFIQERRRYGSRYSILSLAEDEENEDIKYEVYFPTVGQFTGLKDKNGIEIFEGDVLHESEGHIFSGESPRNLTVEFRESECCFAFNEIPNSAALPVYAQYCKIIGNIFQHPELLKP